MNFPKHIIDINVYEHPTKGLMIYMDYPIFTTTEILDRDPLTEIGKKLIKNEKISIEDFLTICHYGANVSTDYPNDYVTVNDWKWFLRSYGWNEESYMRMKYSEIGSPEDTVVYYELKVPVPYSIVNYDGSKQDKNVDGSDNVNHPSHYTQGGIECIEGIEASMPEDEFYGYLKGNAMKYIWRYENKGGKEDLEKAQWYLNKLKEKKYESKEN